ncbi:hypothetical protein SAMN05444673_3968 [Bacillus sp. OV166]|nr:hypothetical protein SAMN05444673_3968 [Bacillus sp. OV166]
MIIYNVYLSEIVINIFVHIELTGALVDHWVVSAILFYVRTDRYERRSIPFNKLKFRNKIFIRGTWFE